MNKQRGGSMTVNGYLALVLLALAVGEAVTIQYLYRHRTIQIHAESHYSPTGIFPRGALTCGSPGVICYKTI